MKVMVMLSKLIIIISYTYYSSVKELATLLLIPFIYKATIYDMIIIYKIWYHDEIYKTEKKSQI